MALRKTNNLLVDTRGEIDDVRQGLAELDIDFTEQTIECFETYITILHDCRDRVHLLSHRDYGRISRRHFLASLVAYPYVKRHERVCDVGAGAGFPSVPLKIVLPAIDFVLFESNRKKAEFLRHLVDRLLLERIRVINSRAEDYSGQGFDLILFKAVGKIDKLMKVVDALVVPGGEVIFFKTQDVGAELRRAARAIEKKGFSAEVREMHTPVEKIPMALVIMRRL
jgi:16S rRNA (guanine527-N7)-methyltransferase